MGKLPYSLIELPFSDLILLIFYSSARTTYWDFLFALTQNWWTEALREITADKILERGTSGVHRELVSPFYTWYNSPKKVFDAIVATIAATALGTLPQWVVKRQTCIRREAMRQPTDTRAIVLVIQLNFWEQKSLATLCFRTLHLLQACRCLVFGKITWNIYFPKKMIQNCICLEHLIHANL